MYRSEDSGHLYLNIDIQPKQNQYSILAKYSETFTQEYIDVGSNYHLAIVRFRIPTTGIPYFVFKIQEGNFQNNNNLGVYAFTFTYMNVDYTEYVNFVPTNLTVAIPPSPMDNEGFQFDSPYYYVYNISEWITMMNFTLNACYQLLIIAEPALNVLSVPFLEYDNTTKEVRLVVSYNWITADVDIFFNDELELFFDGFPITYFNTSGLKTARFEIYATNILNGNGYSPYGVAPTNPPAYIKMVSEYNAFEKWSSFRSIIIKTSLIPIRYENVNSATIRGELSDDTILTDFNVSDFSSNRNDLIFFPQGPYRLIDILSNAPLRSVDLQLFWKDRYGVERPLIIYKNNGLTIKLAFIQKNLTN